MFFIFFSHDDLSNQLKQQTSTCSLFEEEGIWRKMPIAADVSKQEEYYLFPSKFNLELYFVLSLFHFSRFDFDVMLLELLFYYLFDLLNFVLHLLYF